MTKLTAWLFTIIGVLFVLPLISVSIGASLSAWLMALSFLIIGITKIMWAYGKKRR